MTNPFRFALPIALSCSLYAAAAPAGSKLEVRLKNEVNSFSGKAGSRVEAVAIAPLIVNGVVLVPAGSLLFGEVAEVHRVGLGLLRERATLLLNFHTLELPGGATMPVQAVVAEVENAREKVTKEGRILGIRSTNTPGFRASGVLTSFAAVDPIAWMFSTAAFATMLRFSDPEIRLTAGAELILKLTAAVETGYAEDAPTPRAAVSDSENGEMAAMVRRMPYRTRKLSGGEMSDLTNLVFIGEGEAIERAFRAAGWVEAEASTAGTQYRTLRAFAESQTYREAPMSTLLLDGKHASRTLSKTLDTFTKRHHLRIYEHGETWNGKPVYMAAATEDVAIVMDLKVREITHRIDERIDDERSKVVNDLLFTGCVDGAELMARPWVEEGARNGANQKLITDRAIAILRLNDCGSPRDAGEALHNDAGSYRGGRALRITRQTILTIRNDVIRGNLIWQGATLAYQLRRFFGTKPDLESKTLRRQTTLLAFQSNQAKEWEELDDSSTMVYAVAPRSLPRSARIGEPTLSPRADWETPVVELNLTFGTSLFCKSTVGEEALIVSHRVEPGGAREGLALAAGNRISPGWAIGGSVTVHGNRWVSHELGFHYLRGNFQLGLIKLAMGTELPVTGVVEQTAGLLTRQFSYNTLLHLRPIESRLRPYLAAGPAIQLVHLTNAPFQKAKGIYQFGIENVGMIRAAYNFGSEPPLNGGGIFQVGAQMGGGIKFRVAKCWLLRLDYRSTISRRPDFLKKSIATVAATDLAELDARIEPLAAYKTHGLFAQQRVTLGFSFTF